MLTDNVYVKELSPPAACEPQGADPPYLDPHDSRASHEPHRLHFFPHDDPRG